MNEKQENVIRLARGAEIEAQAAAWVTALEREDVSAEELAAFKDWVTESDRNRAAFDELFAFRKQLSVLSELNCHLDIEKKAVRNSPKDDVSFSRRRFAAIAASIAMAFFGGVWTYNNTQWFGKAILYETVVGEQKDYLLKDGSVMVLNTDSRARIEFSAKERIIHLMQGEAYFEVVSDKNRPFLVYAAGGAVKALGTAFSVRVREGAAIEVAVEEGRVALESLLPLESQSSERSDEAASVERAQIGELAAGQIAVFDDSVKRIGDVTHNHMKRKLAWRQGMVAYSGDSLGYVIDDISRYTEVAIEIADPALREIEVSGYFRAGEIETVLASFELNLGIRVVRVNDKYVKLYAAS